MIERIKKIINHYGLSDRAFAIKCGIKQNTFSNQINGVREISLQTINSILITFENISAEWLLRGNGEMLLTSEQPTSSNENDRLSKLIDTIAFQQDTINNLQRKIKELETINKRLEVELTIFKNNKLIG
ncbi:helix-turn-helix domain-containing protein [Phocaeicola fibrisolvens]|uniref:helix-turn-helix domain-containing protein n=1 Tax=Phocaeicola fibrisolvens TaxID=2981793 RepID=UPI0008213798|nr:helix-turn-helix transcriptional regulator [Phocaeicola fibrisolvens]MCU6777323.1 helix-turn-helix domain-containing protein [Phocaeicola fibrisolvens]SCH28160.1 Helix-turn-helix domain [uncultured Bacteroides sp.]